MFFFFFNDTATTEIYTLSLHDALPICELQDEFSLRGTEDCERSGSTTVVEQATAVGGDVLAVTGSGPEEVDRKSTRLNSSHANISYAVFCLKKKKNNSKRQRTNVTEHI